MIWIKNFFIITFFISKFIRKLKSKKINYENLKPYHLKILKEASVLNMKSSNLFSDLKNLKKEEFLEITQSSHTNKAKIWYQTSKFSILFL